MSRNILIVDDSRVSRMMIRAFIQDVHPDWRMVDAANGMEALARTAEESFDLITIDYNMPEMTGVELAEKLRQQGIAARLAFLTANVQDAIRQRAVALGAAFVKKPITPQSIAEIVALLEE